MKSKLIDLIIPLTIIVICGILMGAGIDSEVKSVFIMAAGWAFYGSVRAVKAKCIS